jgi:hypothetical protein
MVLALFAFAFLAMCPVMAEAQALPPGLEEVHRDFRLICGTPGKIMDELRDTHGEVPVVGGTLMDDVQYILYANEDGTTMSFVIHKGDDKACMIWTGASELGQAFMLNPEPQYPEKGESKAWNL